LECSNVYYILDFQDFMNGNATLGKRNNSTWQFLAPEDGRYRVEVDFWLEQADGESTDNDRARCKSRLYLVFDNQEGCWDQTHEPRCPQVDRKPLVDYDERFRMPPIHYQAQETVNMKAFQTFDVRLYLNSNGRKRVREGARIRVTKE
jgi:hypothetical protein